MAAYDREWQRIQYEGGWGGISWPKEYGGADLSLTEQVIWYEQCAAFNAPPSGLFAIALGHAGPTIIHEGSEEQKRAHLEPILRGEHAWAQGFSEPDSGSDLAAASTSAIIDGDELVVNGSKIWGTYAYLCDYQELLLRTDPRAPKHKGLTFVICDLKTPGVEVHPIGTMDGEQHFAQVFYNDVRIPLSNVIGGVNNGWKVALTTLGFERGAMTLGEIIRLRKLLESVRELARTRSDLRGRSHWCNDEIVSRIAQLESQTLALYSLALAFVSQTNRTGSQGPEGSMLRLYFSELSQRIKTLGVELLGIGGLAYDADDDASRYVPAYYYSHAHTIGGGTSEVQRNIIAERVLGLPRA